jgi:hypothetical protein
MSLRTSATRPVEEGPQAGGDLRRILIEAAPGQAQHVMAAKGEVRVPGTIAFERVAGPVVLPAIQLDD